MRTCVFFAVLALLMVPAANGDDKSELKKFQGKWVATALNLNGQEIPADTLKKVPWYWIVEKATIFSKRPGSGGAIHDEKIDFTIDSSKNPNAIDISDRARKETNKGIYELDGDTWKICFAIAGGDRPGDFTAKKGSKRVAITWKRVKD